MSKVRSNAAVSLITLVVIVALLPVSARSADEESPAEAAPPDSEELAARWYAYHADFTGQSSTHAVTRRFEMYNPHSREHLEALKQMGFTQVILDWPNLHPEATAFGLDVVLANWWIDTTEEADINRGFELAAEVDPSRLAGVSMMDEPERNVPDTPLDFYPELYEQLRPLLDAIAPEARLEISHWGPTWSWSDELYEAFVPLYQSADVMRIMPYPDLGEGPLSDVYLMMARSRRLMKLADRELPLLVILQTWTLTPDSDLPTIDELRVMAYQAMLSGAETVSFFDYNLEIWDKTPGFHDEFAGLMTELKSLSDRLADAELVTQMTDKGVLETTVTDTSGTRRLLRVNTNRRPVDGLQPLEVRETLLSPSCDRESFAEPDCRLNTIPCCSARDCSPCHVKPVSCRKIRRWQRRWYRNSCR